MPALTWHGDDETGYIASADDAIYPVVREPGISSHVINVYRTGKDRVPILWQEALAAPRRALIARLIRKGYRLRVVADTLAEGKWVAASDYQEHREPVILKRGHA